MAINMRPTHFIHWQYLPPDSAEALKSYDPYDGTTVLLCHQRKIFEAAWVTKKDPEFRKEIALASKAEGHWLSLHDPVNPFGLGRGRSLTSTYWAPLPNGSWEAEDIKKQSLTLETEDHGDLAFLVEVPDWVQASYRPEIDGWVDIFGYTTPHTSEISRGIVVNLPKPGLARTAAVRPTPDPIWG